MPTIFRSRRFSRQKDILPKVRRLIKVDKTRYAFFLPVVPTSTLGIRFERRALVLLLFGEDDFGAQHPVVVVARIVVVMLRVSSSSGGYLLVFVFFFFGKKIIILSFLCFGETKRRRDLLTFSLSLSAIVLLSGFLQRYLFSRSSSSFTSSSSSANKKDVLLASSGVFEGGRRCSLRGVTTLPI